VATSDEINKLHNMKAMGGLSEHNMRDLNDQIDLAAFLGRHRWPRDANGRPVDANGGKSGRGSRGSRGLRKSKKGGKRVVKSKSKSKSKSAKRCRRNRVKAMRSRRAHRRYMMTV
jgi:hypothetical protein